MAASPDIFALSDADPSQARESFRTVADVLFTQLPHAEIEHVGSTAVPGCLTKGDIDVLVRVTRPDFGASMLALDQMLTRSTRNERTDEYAEYDYAFDGIAASVQLVVAGSGLDNHFHGLKAILTSDEEALAKFNVLKTRCAGGSMTAYRGAKANLIESFLKAHPSLSVDPTHIALRPGIYE